VQSPLIFLNIEYIFSVSLFKALRNILLVRANGGDRIALGCTWDNDFSYMAANTLAIKDSIWFFFFF